MSLFDELLSSGSRHVPASYLQQAMQASQPLKTQLNMLLQQGKLPAVGWTDAMIEQLLGQLAMLDSNNFPHNVGVGEREARIYSGLVSRRNHGLGHGVGRSGDLCAPQPKAAGSSLLYQLTCSMALDAVREAGLPTAAGVVVLPCATGASLLLCLAALARTRPRSDTVVWTRCDQRSCLKAIHTAGLAVEVVEGLLRGDEVVTDVGAVEVLLTGDSRDRVRAVVTTTSCFAPRACDEIEQIATLCQQHGVPHIINNAYGVQSTKLMHRIKEAARLGRVDGVIQSTDKNFMVPVGGAMVVAFDTTFAKSVGETYPGRASMSPITDLFITLLSMGRGTYTRLTKERNLLKKQLDLQLEQVAHKHGLRLLKTPGNPISAGIALPGPLPAPSATALGSMLFTRGVSGARVVTPGKRATVGDTSLTGWGSHHSHYPVAYLTAAASIGMTQQDIDTFITRLDRCLLDWTKRLALLGNGEVENASAVLLGDNGSEVVETGGCCGDKDAEDGGSCGVKDAEDGGCCGAKDAEDGGSCGVKDAETRGCCGVKDAEDGGCCGAKDAEDGGSCGIKDAEGGGSSSSVKDTEAFGSFVKNAECSDNIQTLNNSLEITSCIEICYGNGASVSSDDINLVDRDVDN